MVTDTFSLALCTTVGTFGLTVTAVPVSIGGSVSGEGNCVVTLAMRSTGATKLAYPWAKPVTTTCWRPTCVAGMPVRVNCPCASVIVLRMVPFRATVTLGTGLREVSSTRPVRAVTPPGWAPVTISVIVSDEDATPSEARKASVNVPTCVASGVKTNSPLWALKAACAGKGSGVTAKLTKPPSGSVAATVKASVLPSWTVLFPMELRIGGWLPRLTVKLRSAGVGSSLPA